MALSLTPIYYDFDTEAFYVLNRHGSYEEIDVGGVTIPPTAYASNADAVAALGVGKIYKTTASISDADDQPILSVTY